jgi:hypothetical protein
MTLNHARLPIPPLRQERGEKYRGFCAIVQRQIALHRQIFWDSALPTPPGDAAQPDAPGQAGGVL